MNKLKEFIKDPDAVLDYRFDWSAWLAVDGDTISSHVVTASDGLVVDGSSEADGSVTVWVSGGTPKQSHTLACRVTTLAGRTDERTAVIFIKER
jgi:hypothetical protein